MNDEKKTERATPEAQNAWYCPPCKDTGCSECEGLRTADGPHETHCLPDACKYGEKTCPVAMRGTAADAPPAACKFCGTSAEDCSPTRPCLPGKTHTFGPTPAPRTASAEQFADGLLGNLLAAQRAERAPASAKAPTFSPSDCNHDHEANVLTEACLACIHEYVGDRRASAQTTACGECGEGPTVANYCAICNDVIAKALDAEEKRSSKARPGDIGLIEETASGGHHPDCDCDRQRCTCAVHIAEAALRLIRTGSAQAALEEANRMVCTHSMPYGWIEFQQRNGLPSAAEVLAKRDGATPCASSDDQEKKR